MTQAGLAATQSVPVAGHPSWHFAIVAAAAVLTFGGIKVAEWWRRSAFRMRPPSLSLPSLSLPSLSLPSLSLMALAALSLACSGMHAWVCREHFQEWVVYGIFFLCASTLQAGWSVLILVRPSATLLLAGVAGNAAVVVTYAISRSVGIPFGPDAYRPESVNPIGLAATMCELAAEGLATYLLIRRDPRKVVPALTAAA